MVSNGGEVPSTPNMPELESVRILRLEPGDEIVLTLRDRATHADVDALRKMAEEHWPGHRVSVLSAGIEMAVVRS